MHDSPKPGTLFEALSVTIRAQAEARRTADLAAIIEAENIIQPDEEGSPLFSKQDDGKKPALWVPQTVRKSVINLTHGADHVAPKEQYRYLDRYLTWPNMEQEIFQ